MTDELDDALASSAPPVSARTPALTRALDSLALEAELGARPRPSRRRRAGVVAAVTVGVLGVGAGAFAGGNLLPRPSSGDWGADPLARHVTLTLPSGERCDAYYVAAPNEVEKLKHSQTEWDEAWKVAGEAMRSADADVLTSPRVLDRYRREADAARRHEVGSLPADEVVPRETEASMILGAPGAELIEQVDEALRAHGLDPDMLVMTSGNNCDPDRQ